MVAARVSRQAGVMRLRRSLFADVFCRVPVASYACLLGFATLAYFKVGHWPLYNRPDPKELRFPFLYGASVLAYPLTVLAILSGMIDLIWHRESWSRVQAALLMSGAA